MKQHILRLLIVLCLVVGFGAIIISCTNKNAPFVVTEFVNNQSKQDKKIEDNFGVLNSIENYSSFTEKVAIYNSLDNNINFYTKLLVNANFSKDETSKIKNAFKQYQSEVNKLNSSMIMLKSYISDPNKNTIELEGRKNKVNNDFLTVLSKKIEIVNALNKTAKSKIYSDNCFDAKFILVNTTNILSDLYLDNLTIRNNFTFTNNVIVKTNSFINSNKIAVDNIIKYVIKFNQMTEQTVKSDFNVYFQNGTVNDDLQVLINYLNSEAYYEEV